MNHVKGATVLNHEVHVHQKFEYKQKIRSNSNRHFLSFKIWREKEAEINHAFLDVVP
jgi:hypothetical protein